MEQREKMIYVGVDLHKQHHTAVIVDCWNNKLGEIQFDNKPTSFPALLKEVKKHLKKGMTAVYGLEDVGGYGRALAVYLNECACWVKEVNPILSNARRKSHVTVQKSDSWDAECVARVLRDEPNNLPDAKPIDLYWALSQLVTQRKWIVKNQTGLNQKLHQQLSYHYPSYKKFFSQVDGKTALAFWERYPSPCHLDGVAESTLASFLRELSNFCLSTGKAAQILSLVKEDGDTRRDFQEKRDFIVQSIVRNIRFNQEELTRIEEEIRSLIKGLGFQLETMTGIDVITAAELVAEIGDIHRFATPDKLARFAGIAPIFVGSGGKGRNYKSKQGNRVLHELFKSLAIRQLAVTRGKREPRNPYFYSYYEQKVAVGKTKKQAVVCIMRKLVNVIHYLMRTKAAYVIPPVPEKEAG
ncbi:IS110 family transposase [Brevibacillus reuszeri]|uniref:Transposase n=1 Tax=Brevibacillus reuszeri TaxID=54915 RepID=A0A0K9YWU3_9BACL|nr:IS110 family transposase [Brevibacillus reuszeri]KNB73158.1 transposase [Brevibacillus reuszeri]MED1856752.1 IS110 family transposase [Brevibacillus reuszeri]GED68500.1 IS110 family transposase [Brevibacillus reuszeri]